MSVRAAAEAAARERGRRPLPPEVVRVLRRIARTKGEVELAA